MRNKKLLLIGILIWNLNSVFGQVCGTPHPTNPTVYPQEESNLQAKGSSSAICIDLFFHIVRNTNGTNAFVMPNLDAIINDLNEFYSPHNIIINNAGNGFIDDTNFVNIDNEIEARNLGQTNNRNNAINYYIVETLWNVNGGFITGTANSIPSNNLVIRNDRVLTSTSAHELGHCLNLLHTHETARGVEANNGSNCATAGDLICDTPADPRLGTNNVNGNCIYFGGNGFNPLTNNIMSYSRGICRDEFTNGQGHRMRLAINRETVLQNITSNSCTSISEVNNVCFPQTKTISIANINGAITNWTTSNNVHVVSQNNSSITIRGLNSNSTGDGWVQATLNNGIQFTENFEVGIPRTENINIHKQGSFKLYNNTWNWIHARYNGSYDYNIPNWEWHFYASQGVSIMTRSAYKSTIHVRPTADGTVDIQTRVSNECGCSGWRSKVYQIGNGGGSTGSGPGLEW